MTLSRILINMFKGTVIFLATYLLPGVIASIISMDLNVYVEAVTNPAYVGIIGVGCIWFAAYCLSCIIEADQEQKRIN